METPSLHEKKTPRADRPALGIALMVLAMFLLSVMDAVSKHLTDTLAVPQILAIRFWIFILFALALASSNGLARTIRSATPGLQLLRSVIMLGQMSAFIFAVTYLPLADVGAIFAVAPLLIMLLANPNLNITTIDMVEKFSKVSTEYLQDIFPKSKINFLKGNSLDILPKLKEKFDLFHIDGSHSRSIIKKEFEKCIFLSKDENIKIVFDDYDTCKTLNNTIDRSFDVRDSLIPRCESRNRYLRIVFKDQNELKNYLKIFKKMYIKEYLKELPKRALNFKAIYNKIVVALRHLPEK